MMFLAWGLLLLGGLICSFVPLLGGLLWVAGFAVVLNESRQNS